MNASRTSNRPARRGRILPLWIAVAIAGAAPLAPLRAQTPTAQNADSVVVDADADMAADRGDTVQYDVQVSNPTAAAALLLMFSSSIDANADFVAGSLNISPLALDEAYDTPGNTLLEVGTTPTGVPSRKIAPGGAGDSVLDNDREFLGDSFTLTPIVAGASANGGTVNLNADGTFTYLPPVGFSGSDSFTYTIRDDGTDGTPNNADDMTGVGTVTIAVGTRIWYVDDSAPGGGDGRSSAPFNSLAAVTGATGPDMAGDTIYVHAGTYATGLTLLNNQTLHGEGTALTVGANPIHPGGAAPTISNGSGHALTLAQGNAATGVTLGATPAASYSLFGNNFGALTVSSCSIANGTGGAASLTTGTPNVSLASLSSTGSTGTAAVNLDACGGSFSASGGTIVAGSGPGWRINAGTVASTYSGAISQANNAALVSVSGGHATGAVLFQTGALSATNGTGLQFDDADSTADYTFNGTVTLSGGDAGIDIANGSAGDFAFANAPITNPSGAAFVVNGGNGTISHAGAISKSSAGRLIDFQSRSGGSISVSGNLSSTGMSTGINISGCSAGSSTFTFSGGTKTLNTGANAAVTIASNSNGTRVDFTNGGLDIDTSTGTGINASSTGQTGGAAGISVQGANNTIDCSGSGTCLSLNSAPATANGMTFLRCVSSTGQVANINTSSGTKTLGRVATSSGATTAMSLVAGGTVEVGDGAAASTLTTTSGTGLAIGGTTLNITGTGLDITTSGGGTGLAHQGATTAIAAASLDILTDGASDGPGLVATAGGTFSLTGSNNTVSSGNRTAINVANTTIAAAGVTFRSVASSGGSETGIILSNTGSSGGLTVAGSGSAGSGGTIANKTGADGSTNTGVGIHLNSTTNPSFTSMQLNDFQNFAIRGSTVSGFTLASTVINGTNGTNDGFDEGCVRFTELTGSASVTSSNISGGHEDNFAVVNTGGSLNRITFSSTTFGANSTSFGSDGILIEGQNAAVVNATVQNGFFTSTRGDHFQLNLIGTASSNLQFTGNTLSNAHPAVVSGGGGIRLTGGAAGGNVTATYNFANNTMRDSNGTAIGVTKGAGSGTFTGTIDNNDIGLVGVLNSGSLAGSGISVITAEAGTSTVAITRNRIRQYANFGIIVQAGGLPTVGTGTLNATVTGNTVSNPGNPVFAKNGIQLNSGTVPGDAFQVCFSCGGAGALANSIAGSGTDGGTDFRVRQRQSTTVRLPGYGGANNNDAAVVTFLQGQNGGTPTGSATNTVPTGGGWIGGAACP